MTHSRPLVLCADDYGMNPGVNRAILELAEEGRLSAASCMTNAPGWPEAARALPLADGRLGIGLHLTLTWGRPLGPMPSHAPSGDMPSLGASMARALAGRAPIGEIRDEIARQLDAFQDALGRRPDFVDGHQHVHVLPGIRSALLDVMSMRGLAGRVWLRDPSDRVGSIVRRGLAAGKALLVGALASGFRKAALEAGFQTNEGFSGFSAFDPDRDPGSDMVRYLTDLGPRPVLMCHPGRPDPDPDPIAEARAREWRYLGSSAFPALLEAHGLELAPRPR